MGEVPVQRECLAEPPPECFKAALFLKAAVEAHRARATYAAADLFRAADMLEVRAFIERMWGSGAKQLHAFISVPNAPRHLPIAEQPRPRMPSAATKAALIERDGYHCRFCGLPVIRAAVRQRIRAAYPDVVGWESTNASQHAAFQCLWLQYDHILPNSRGGPSTLENMVVTCAACNFGRMETTISEAQLIDPLSHGTPRKWGGFEDWNGLEDFEACGSATIKNQSHLSVTRGRLERAFLNFPALLEMEAALPASWVRDPYGPSFVSRLIIALNSMAHDLNVADDFDLPAVAREVAHMLWLVGETCGAEDPRFLMKDAARHTPRDNDLRLSKNDLQLK